MSLPAPSLRRPAAVALCALAAVCALPARAAHADAGDVIVRYAATARAAERVEARELADVRRAEGLPVSGMEIVRPEAGTTARRAAAALEGAPGVLSAEPDAPRRVALTVNDPSFPSQWALLNALLPGADIDAVAAWDITHGSPDVRVAVVDSGVQADHPDLAPNLDMADGWDFVDDDATPNDGKGHGTHVAGTIGARGDDGLGVTGVAWGTTLLPVRVLDDNGDGYTSDAIRGYAYAAAHGARIVNASLGGARRSDAEYAAIRAARDVLFVVAAGNAGANVDAAPQYPCAYDLPNVVCVAATDDNDRLAEFSNYGAANVDLAAPGDDILSTWPGGRWAYLEGTSMATPHVAGAAALVLAQQPGLTPWQVRQVVLESVDRVTGLAGKVASGGRLNAARALGAPVPDASLQPAVTDPAPAPRLTAPVTSPPADTTPPASQPSPPPATTPPATPPTTGSSPARAPPIGLTLGAARTGRLASLLRSGARATVRATRAATVTVELRVDARTARRLRLGGKALAIGRTQAALAAGGSRTLTVALTARVRSAVRRARIRTLRATLRAGAPGAAPRTVTLTLR